MTSYVELRHERTPVEYLTLPVRYDAWGDPYVKLGFFESLFSRSLLGPYAMRPSGRTDNPFVAWKLVGGEPVKFPKNTASRGWRP